MFFCLMCLNVFLFDVFKCFLFLFFMCVLLFLWVFTWFYGDFMWILCGFYRDFWFDPTIVSVICVCFIQIVGGLDELYKIRFYTLAQFR